MKQEYDEQLCKDFPKLYARRNDSPEVTCMCWGFTIGDGWYPVIKTLSGLLQWYCDQHPEVTQVVVSQVKEKFGGLRFYVDGGDEVTNAYITFAEAMCDSQCEQCGSPGSRQNINGGGVFIICPACFEKGPQL